jgi:hypothetical protein
VPSLAGPSLVSVVVAATTRALARGYTPAKTVAGMTFIASSATVPREAR